MIGQDELGKIPGRKAALRRNNPYKLAKASLTKHFLGVILF